MRFYRSQRIVPSSVAIFTISLFAIIYYRLPVCSFQPCGERVRYLLIKSLGESRGRTVRGGEKSPHPVGSTTATSQFPAQKILVKSTRLSRPPKLMCVEENHAGPSGRAV